MYKNLFIAMILMAFQFGGQAASAGEPPPAATTTTTTTVVSPASTLPLYSWDGRKFMCPAGPVDLCAPPPAPIKTPRTDALWAWYKCEKFGQGCDKVPADFVEPVAGAPAAGATATATTTVVVPPAPPATAPAQVITITEIDDGGHPDSVHLQVGLTVGPTVNEMAFNPALSGRIEPMSLIAHPSFGIRAGDENGIFGEFEGGPVFGTGGLVGIKTSAIGGVGFGIVEVGGILGYTNDCKWSPSTRCKFALEGVDMGGRVGVPLGDLLFTGSLTGQPAWSTMEMAGSSHVYGSSSLQLTMALGVTWRFQGDDNEE